jgi:hypothetical protein
VCFRQFSVLTGTVINTHGRNLKEQMRKGKRLRGFLSSRARAPSDEVGKNQRREWRQEQGLYPSVKCPVLVLDPRVPRIPLIVLQDHGLFQSQHVEAVTSLGYLGVCLKSEGAAAASWGLALGLGCAPGGHGASCPQIFQNRSGRY